MEVQIEVGKGIQCDGIEIMFGNSISSVVKAVGEVDKYEDNYYFYESSLLVHVDSNNCIDEIEIRNDEEHSHVVMLNDTNIFSETKDIVVELITVGFSVTGVFPYTYHKVTSEVFSSIVYNRSPSFPPSQDPA